MTDSAGQISSGINSLMQQYLTVANNIANASTVGYKRSISSFSADLSRQIQNVNDASLSSGEIEVASKFDFSQGQIVSTGRSLDIALEGNGFLVLETPDGPLYTRAGSLDVNKLGQLVNSSGRLVAGENGPIVIPKEASLLSVSVNPDGVVSADGQEVGKLKVVEFKDGTDDLKTVGFGAYQASTDNKPEPAKKVQVRQGCQESSNVRIMEEVVNLMSLSRVYESHMNILKQQRDNNGAMLSVANNQG
jgi:flagellar basal body rod protein FlgG